MRPDDKSDFPSVSHQGGVVEGRGRRASRREGKIKRRCSSFINKTVVLSIVLLLLLYLHFFIIELIKHRNLFYFAFYIHLYPGYGSLMHSLEDYRYVCLSRRSKCFSPCLLVEAGLRYQHLLNRCSWVKGKVYFTLEIVNKTNEIHVFFLPLFAFVVVMRSEQ